MVHGSLALNLLSSNAKVQLKKPNSREQHPIRELWMLALLNLCRMEISTLRMYTSTIDQYKCSSCLEISLKIKNPVEAFGFGELVVLVNHGKPEMIMENSSLRVNPSGGMVTKVNLMSLLMTWILMVETSLVITLRYGLINMLVLERLKVVQYL